MQKLDQICILEYRSQIFVFQVVYIVGIDRRETNWKKSCTVVEIDADLCTMHWQ